MDIQKNSTSKIGALIRIKSSFFKYAVFMIHIRINVKIEERCPAHLSSQHSAAHFSRPLLLEMEDRQTTGAICFPQKQVNIDFLLSLVSLYAAADRLCNIASLNVPGCSCWPDIAKLVCWSPHHGSLSGVSRHQQPWHSTLSTASATMT